MYVSPWCTHHRGHASGWRASHHDDVALRVSWARHGVAAGGFPCEDIIVGCGEPAPNDYVLLQLCDMLCTTTTIITTDY